MSSSCGRTSLDAVGCTPSERFDAYFCDAYTDIIAATIISKNRQPAIALPDFFYDVKVPIRAILEPYTDNVNWRWRMAARKMMERETVLSLKSIQDLFNKFFRRRHRFFRDLLGGWIDSPDAKKRLFGITRSAYLALATPADRETAIKDAWDQMQERYRNIFSVVTIASTTVIGQECRRSR